MTGQIHPVDLQQHLADQRVPIGMQTRRAHRDDDVAGFDPVGTQHIVRLDDADAGGRDIVVIGLDQARMFCGLAAKQRTAGTHAPIGDTGDDRAESLRHDPTDGDVIQQEQRLGAANHQVIDHHRHQVQAHRVVLIHRLSDREFGADASLEAASTGSR